MEITGEGIVTKKELLQKIADQTLVQDFANEENFLLINVGAEKQYLVRPTPTCEVKKRNLEWKECILSEPYCIHFRFVRGWRRNDGCAGADQILFQNRV